MNILNKLYIGFFPILIFRVKGNSMLPTFHPEQKLIAWRFFKPRKRDVVICKDPRNGRLLLKRVTYVRHSGKQSASRIRSWTSQDDRLFFVKGDNIKESTDSRSFGVLTKNDILAKVIYPKTVYTT